MYLTISDMHHSGALLARCSAAVAGEVAAGAAGDTANVDVWVLQRSWDLAATPGWAPAWESAVAGGVVDPGADPTVITDAMVLARVQPLLELYPLPDAP